MGHTSLVSMIETAGPDVAFEWHMSSNFYPPLHEGARETARTVYRRIRDHMYWPDELLEWRMANDDHGRVYAHTVVETCHLEVFIEYYAQEEVEA